MTFAEKQERANIFTHAIGIVLSLVGAYLLLSKGSEKWETFHIIGLSIFCFSLLFVYTSSTIYHSVNSKRLKWILRKVDHIAIYLLIGGTHTPFVLLYSNNAFGKYYLMVLWGLIAFGIIYKIFLMGRWQWLSLAFYIFLGWMAIFIIPKMNDQMPDIVLYWIIGGGLSYTLGTIFFSWEKLPYHHAIWHLFVIGGSFGHYIAIYLAYN